MKNDTTKPLNKVIRIDESEIRGHLDEMVRGTVEKTLNALLDAEADEMYKAQRYERSPDRVDTRAGSYTRKLQTKAGEIEVNMPKLRKQTFDIRIAILVSHFLWVILSHMVRGQIGDATTA